MMVTMATAMMPRIMIAMATMIRTVDADNFEKYFSDMTAVSANSCQIGFDTEGVPSKLAVMNWKVSLE